MAAGGILMGLGTLSIAYFILYAVLVDLNNVFTFFWLLLGIGLLVAGFWIFRIYQKGHVLPKWFAATAGTVCGIGVLLFILVLGCIVREAHMQPENGADYMIVLGARVKGDRISPLLRYRLEEALDYLSENQDTIAVVSGGKGAGENVSEAEAMQEYLVEHGIAGDRILLEDASANTDQNIRNSIWLIREQERLHKEQEELRTDLDSEEKTRIVLVSNGFHLFRAKRLLQKQLRDAAGGTGKASRNESGLQDSSVELEDAVIEGLGAKTTWYVAPNSYVREIFAVIKYRLSGQI